MRNVKTVKTIERGAEVFLPADKSLAGLREAVQACQGCELYKNATQAVFGAGPETAPIVLIGEAPGDSEDRQGAPFVGPASRILDRALEDLGIPRSDIYITNAVKHFKWVPKGNRRIHQAPRISEIRACQPWLESELDALKPALIVCLGATAVQSLLGPSMKLLVNRGRVIESNYGPCLLTVHPSSIIRIEDIGDRQAAYDAFIADLAGGLAFLTRTGF